MQIDSMEAKVYTAANGTRYQWHGDSHGDSHDDKDGLPIVLVHGLGLNRAMWQWQLPGLCQNYRVLTYDLFGHGESSPAPAEPDLTVFCNQILALLDANNIAQCALFGFSLGGMIARRFAIDHAERLAALGILNSPHARAAAEQSAIEKRVAEVAATGASATLDAAIARWFSVAFQQTHPQVIALVRSWIMANDPKIYAQNYRILATGVAELIAPQPPIACPTLVMTAAQDAGQPAPMAHAIAAEIKGSETVIIDGLRHLAMVEAPSQYNAAMLDFLNRAVADTRL